MVSLTQFQLYLLLWDVQNATKSLTNTNVYIQQLQHEATNTNNNNGTTQSIEYYEMHFLVLKMTYNLKIGQVKLAIGICQRPPNFFFGCSDRFLFFCFVVQLHV